MIWMLGLCLLAAKTPNWLWVVNAGGKLVIY